MVKVSNRLQSGGFIMSQKDASACVHCHKCRDNCSFLKKYGIDIGDIERLKELAYHCFLCGKCTEVCPINIDGRQTVIDFRRERVRTEERTQIEKTYKGALSEKRNYKFRNWKHASTGSVFFPGCNFPSLFPKTCSKASEIFEKHGIGTVFECCGKPVGELGFASDEERIFDEIRSRLRENGIDEIIVACPNCRGFFGDKLGVKVTGVYAKLKELGEGRELMMDARFFLPCPDRQGSIWMEEIKEFIKGEITYVEGVQCCGLGGNAIVKEKEISQGFTEEFKRQNPGDVYTYCASCTGRIVRKGFRSINHILPLILETGEKPDTSKSYLNRVFTKFK